MSIFTEMYDLRVFESIYAYRDLLRKLTCALEEGWIEEIPVVKHWEVQADARWFRDMETREVYALVSVEGKPSSWHPVAPEELFPSSPTAVSRHMTN